MMAVQSHDLVHRAVAVLVEYFLAKCKSQWEQFRTEMPHQTMPGAYWDQDQFDG